MPKMQYDKNKRGVLVEMLQSYLDYFYKKMLRKNKKQS